MKGYFLLFFICCTLLCYGQPGIINTVAGNGSNSSNGDGGIALNASMRYPADVIIDSLQNILTSDFCSNTVRKINVSGIINTIAGDGTMPSICAGAYGGDGGLAISAQLSHPSGLAIDSLGNIFIADAENHRIRKISVTTNIITTIVGIGTAGYSGDGGLATDAELGSPTGIAFDPAGNMYIVDHGTHTLRKVNTTGVITTIAGTGGVSGFSGDGGISTSSLLNSPNSVTVDDSGNVYVCDSWNNRIRKINANDSVITTIAGTGNIAFNGDNILAVNANLSNPADIILDDSNNVYIAEESNHRVRKIGNNGIITTVAGIGTSGFSGDGGSALLAQLSSPLGIAFDIHGNLYIADNQNRRIRKVEQVGVVGIRRTIRPDNLFIYPNPASSQLTITGNKIASISISNTLGQIVHWQKVSEDKTVVDMSALHAGMYFVTVTDRQGAKMTKKVVKQ